MNQIYIRFLTRFSKRQLIWVLIGSGLTSILSFLLMSPASSLMNQSGYSIFQFELAFTKRTMDRILQAWTPFLSDAQLQTYIDYLFIFSYVFFLCAWGMLLLLSLSPSINPSFSRFPLSVLVLTPAFTIFAGCCDIVENIFILYILFHPSTYPGAMVAIMSSCSLLKFLLLTIVLLTLLIYSLSLLFNKRPVSTI